MLEGALDCIHDIKDALAVVVTTRMTDSAYKVETTSRLAQWKIENLASCSYRKSNPFRIGKWNWHLAVERSRTLLVKLFPEISNWTRENPPIASFVIRVLTSATGDRKSLIHPEVIDRQLKSSETFIWSLDIPFAGKFIIDVEFLDLKIASPAVEGGDPYSIFNSDLFPRLQSDHTALTCLGRMLFDSILSDIIIHTTSDNGSIRAHRAVLASRSPVFMSMFSHDLCEKEHSTIAIPDMSLDACRAFLAYIYGCVDPDEFRVHRMALLCAANKYGVEDLKEACHNSLIEDVDSSNVLERLQCAWLYGLPRLKECCLRYLVRFGKVFDLRDEFNEFLMCADRELIGEVFYEILDIWKGF